MVPKKWLSPPSTMVTMDPFQCWLLLRETWLPVNFLKSRNSWRKLSKPWASHVYEQHIWGIWWWYHQAAGQLHAVVANLERLHADLINQDQNGEVESKHEDKRSQTPSVWLLSSSCLLSTSHAWSRSIRSACNYHLTPISCITGSSAAIANQLMLTHMFIHFSFTNIFCISLLVKFPWAFWKGTRPGTSVGALRPQTHHDSTIRLARLFSGRVPGW